MVLAFATAIFIMISLWCVYKFFATSKPSQYLIHSSILINRLFCVCYVISIVIIDVIYGEHYIFWYTSLSSRFVCLILSVMLSSGMVMYNLSISLLDCITQMAVTSMLFNQGSVYSKVRISLFSSHLLVVTAFTMLIFLTHDLINHRLSPNRLCSTPLGFSLVAYNWLRVDSVCPVIIAIIIFISFVYSIFTNIVIYIKTYSSGKCVQSMASTIGNHRNKLIHLFTTLCLSTVFRSLECLPTIFLVFLILWGTDISLETQLVSILASVCSGCLCNMTLSVWKRRSKREHFLIEKP